MPWIPLGSTDEREGILMEGFFLSWIGGEGGDFRYMFGSQGEGWNVKTN
jgi:hypothetical protein